MPRKEANKVSAQFHEASRYLSGPKKHVRIDVDAEKPFVM